MSEVIRNVGHKVLVSVKPLDDVIVCTRIRQVSPSGRFVELSGNDVDIQCLGWKLREDVTIHEVL